MNCIMQAAAPLTFNWRH